ncbi:uncharacterized protein [Diadema antillarum]|uniref:uncharacterized protein n=1 Tax=Diadema antillarum TaxID=105358 RepID=UPI003A88750D
MAKASQNVCPCALHIKILYTAFAFLCLFTMAMFMLVFGYVSHLRDTEKCIPDAPGRALVQGTATLHQSLHGSDAKHDAMRNGTGNARRAMEGLFDTDDMSKNFDGNKRIIELALRKDHSHQEKEAGKSENSRSKRDAGRLEEGRRHVLATIPISIPLSSIANVCNWTNEGCPSGPQGEPGPPGRQGLPGHRGLPGQKGETGAKGRRGERGPMGHPGARGDSGDRGEKGDMGLQGPQGPPGSPGPSGPSGVHNCSCAGLERRAYTPEQEKGHVSLGELEKKMRKLLLQSAISCTVVANHSSEDTKVLIDDCKKCGRQNTQVPGDPASSEPKLDDVDLRSTTQSDFVLPGSRGDQSRLERDGDESRDAANHEYSRLHDDGNSGMKQLPNLNVSRTTDRPPNHQHRHRHHHHRSNTNNARGRGSPDDVGKIQMNDSFSSGGILLSAPTAMSDVSPGITEEEEEFIRRDPNDLNIASISQWGALSADSEDDTTEETKMHFTNATSRPTQLLHRLSGGTHMESDEQRSINISTLLERLTELTANRSMESLINLVHMSISSRGHCGCPCPPGPRGRPGPAGIPGLKGDKGDTGENGLKGAAGRPGPQGRNGAPGTSGLPGMRGLKGEPGEMGPEGMKGDDGEMGLVGPMGEQGFIGPKGPKGESGVMGPKGSPGPTGPFGPRGEPGRIGKTGPRGPPGEPCSHDSPGERLTVNMGQDDRGRIVQGTTATPSVTMGMPPAASLTTKPTIIDPTEKMLKIDEPFVKSQCHLTQISEPNEIHTMVQFYGTWMKDTFVNTTQPDKIWVTMHHKGAVVLEYKRLADVKASRPFATFSLPFPWDGNGHVVYNGSLFYHQRDTAYMVKYNLFNGVVATRRVIPNLGYHLEGPFQMSSGHTNVDFSVDQNGLWAVYPLARGGQVGKLAVSKLDPDTLQIITTVTTDHNFQSTANAFIICGVLYTSKGPNSRPSKIDFAYDLLREVELQNTGLVVANRYRKTVMLSYNPRDGLLYGWDKGRMVTFQLHFNEQER